jgi:hypothetical protein
LFDETLDNLKGSNFEFCARGCKDAKGTLGRERLAQVEDSEPTGELHGIDDMFDEAETELAQYRDMSYHLAQVETKAATKEARGIDEMFAEVRLAQVNSQAREDHSIDGMFAEAGLAQVSSQAVKNRKKTQKRNRKSNSNSNNLTF